MNASLMVLVLVFKLQLILNKIEPVQTHLVTISKILKKENNNAYYSIKLFELSENTSFPKKIQRMNLQLPDSNADSVSFVSDRKKGKNLLIYRSKQGVNSNSTRFYKDVAVIRGKLAIGTKSSGKFNSFTLFTILIFDLASDYPEILTNNGFIVDYGNDKSNFLLSDKIRFYDETGEIALRDTQFTEKASLFAGGNKVLISTAFLNDKHLSENAIVLLDRKTKKARVFRSGNFEVERPDCEEFTAPADITGDGKKAAFWALFPSTKNKLEELWLSELDLTSFKIRKIYKLPRSQNETGRKNAGIAWNPKVKTCLIAVKTGVPAGSAYSGESVLIINTRTGIKQKEFTIGKNPKIPVYKTISPIKWSPDGNILAFADSGKVYLYDNTKQKMTVLENPDEAYFDFVWIKN